MFTKYKDIIIDQSANIKDALRQIDSNEDKILFVVDNSYKLIGSLTDGDIRRWILSDGALIASVGEVCFKGTYFVTKDFDEKSVIQNMHEKMIEYVPIISENGSIIDFLVRSEIDDIERSEPPKNFLDATVVIMAGGNGTRLDPFTKILPKPLIPIGEKTILELIIDKFLDFNVELFYISVNHKAKIIKSYFEEIMPPYTIQFIDEEIPLGTIGAIKILETKVINEVILTNCDIIITADYSDILEFHRINGNKLTIVGSLKHIKIPYGVCEISHGGELVNISEKPELDFLISTGMYIIDPDIISLIPNDTFYNATDLIEKVRLLGLKVAVYPISENSWIDIGEWKEYKKAVVRLST
jgi:dTDP-glucose pyrophosphorylase